MPRGTDMSWNRILESSKALEASPRSTAASMLGAGVGDEQGLVLRSRPWSIRFA